MYQTLKADELIDRDCTPARRERVVVAAPLTVISTDPVRCLLDEPVIDEAVQRAVRVPGPIRTAPSLNSATRPIRA